MPLIGDSKTIYQREYMRRMRSKGLTSKELAKQAGRILRKAIQKREIIKPRCCEACHSKEYIVAHHPDYNKPLEVLWVCSACHKKLHMCLAGKQRKKFNPYINPLLKVARNREKMITKGLPKRPELDADGNVIPEYD